jgi:hypothetical protein
MTSGPSRRINQPYSPLNSQSVKYSPSRDDLDVDQDMPERREIEETLDTSTMSQRHTYCLTLRLEPRIEELIAEAAYDRGITKSDYIRAAISKSLKTQQEQHDKRRDQR